MRYTALHLSLIGLPLAAMADGSSAQDGIPVYVRNGDSLMYFNYKISPKDAMKLGQGQIAAEAFGRPVAIINTAAGNTPIYILPSEYERQIGGDGVIPGQPDELVPPEDSKPKEDLVFKEDEGTDTREDLVFGEHEGTNTRDDLVFKENEGTDTREDLVFGEHEGTNTRDDLVFKENEGTDTREDLVFGENEGTDTRDDLVFKENEGTDTRDDLVFTEDEGLTVVEREGGPVDMLKSNGASFIQPNDGFWRVTITQANASGCPAGVAEAAQSQLSASNAKNIAYSKPKWHPGDMGGEYAKLRWQTVGQNGYFAYVYEQGKEAQGSGMSMAVSAAFKVRAPNKIEGWHRINVNLAPALAQMVGGSTKCRVVIKSMMTQ